MLSQTVCVFVKLHANDAGEGARVLAMEVALVRAQMVPPRERLLAQGAAVLRRGRAGRAPQLVAYVLLQAAHTSAGVEDAEGVAVDGSLRGGHVATRRRLTLFRLDAGAG